MGRRVSIPRLLLANTHPRFACTPNTNVGPTPGPTKTGESSTKEAGKLSELNISKPCGRRNTMNGSSAPRPSCPSGSVRGPAKRLETQSPLKTKMRVVPRLPLLRITKKKRRKKKKKRKRKKKRRKKKSKSRSKFCDDHTNLSPSIHPYEEEIRAKQKRNPTRPWIECFSIFFVTL